MQIYDFIITRIVFVNMYRTRIKYDSGVCLGINSVWKIIIVISVDIFIHITCNCQVRSQLQLSWTGFARKASGINNKFFCKFLFLARLWSGSLMNPLLVAMLLMRKCPKL